MCNVEDVTILSILLYFAVQTILSWKYKMLKRSSGEKSSFYSRSKVKWEEVGTAMCAHRPFALRLQGG